MKKFLIGMAAALILSSCGKDVISDPLDEDDNKDNGSNKDTIINGNISHNGSTYESDIFLAYYPLNGNAFDAVGDVDGREEKVTYVTDRFGKSNSAARTPYGCYIDIIDDSKFDFQSDFSISVWAKSVPNGNHKDWMGHIDIVGKWGGGQEFDSYMIGTTTNGMFEAWIDNTNRDVQLTSSNVNAFDNNWHNLTLTYNVSTQRASFYVDGILTDQKTTGYPRNSGNNFRIGGRTDGYADFDGIIDDVMIFNRELSSEHVSQIMLF